ncbi:hypothetical protein RBH29_12640 [Herbivorax sp. ANBcel31]|uniref:DUF6688 domain-containing protein n=1 Tax=Herbivorax sp. ANBcel31 TaxID=3069754 RepID=UPI0027B28A9F|nr:DUF6688 family protein [Herbivorax sp. ANBcel31]MDQ2087272.1 hypothetical protein [Herbivorax sp. ANBcel31]
MLNSIFNLLTIAILFLIFVIPFVITILNIINLIKKTPIKENVIDFITFFLGLPLTIILFNLLELKEYHEPLYTRTFEFQFHTPISSEYMKIILLVGFISILGYWILRIHKKNMSPVKSILSISTIYLGIGLSILFIIQLSKNIFTSGYMFPFEILFLSLFPLNYILCSVRLIRQVIFLHVHNRTDNSFHRKKMLIKNTEKEIPSLNSEYQIEKAESKETQVMYKSKLLNLSYKILSKSVHWYTAAFILVIPVLGLLLGFLVLFGQSPDSIIKAFTQTSDWTLSQKISPPPIEYEGHYLCTVALKGHEKLVKPTRKGIRHGKTIIVNRQLCIANAFEQLIQEKAPLFHKSIRTIYNKYGYPLSRHIKTNWQADIIYILMKPLEWFFLIVLYTFDIKPENRIALQYISK